ncbi:MAG: Periplasmic trehalase [Steroidobacteraceae bacterium]|nr:Periplasmic trehalase [Steroidobacteraceae bacterium]
MLLPCLVALALAPALPTPSPAQTVAAHPVATVATPLELYPGLFERVQMEQVFPDGKTFVDAVPRESPQAVLAAYRRQAAAPGFDLRAFVAAHFVAPSDAASRYRTGDADVTTHIDRLWSVLTRPPDVAVAGSSLLPLPYRYVVPGGRFRKIYYWDSYFTMLGLEESGRHDLARDLLRNFAYLIDACGHVPNGNRSYYLSRSQPPFFAAMVGLIARHDGEAVLVQYLPQLEREHAFWMAGAAGLARGAAHRRVVRLADGSLLNRYWDDRDVPREESWREDVATAREAARLVPPRPAAEVYRNLRAAAESGWDFSSRWLADGHTLATIRTVDIIPVDLNSLLYHLEQTLARAYRAAGREADARRIGARAWARREAIHRHLWDPVRQIFGDLAWREGRFTSSVSAAMLYPLYFGVATRREADGVAATVRRDLLASGGLETTTVASGEQWDAPNGWAPLQWLAVEGLRRYGQQDLAAEIARRWIHENLAVYRTTGKLVEKYDVGGGGGAGGGEYPAQDGFGWTNGVLRRLLALYPPD